jgi:hypothetical protein
MMAHNEVEKRTLGGDGENHIHASSRDIEVQISKAEDGTGKKLPLGISQVPAREEDDSEKMYPPTQKVVIAMIALYLSLFSVSLVSSPRFHNNLIVPIVIMDRS